MTATTTDYLQKIPNRFSSCEDVKNIKEENTNSRYRKKNFNQIQFTAGDTQQFETFRSKTNGSDPYKRIDLTDNIYSFYTPENTEWEKYKNLDVKSVDNTFNYLFYKFKKAIFVKIQDNELKVFLPFSNVNYTNEWSDQMKAPSGKTIVDHILDLNALHGYRTNKNRINSFVNNWYGNNCLIRNEYPTGEGDSGIPNIIDMLKTLCKERSVPDIEFFINRRDFPLITKDSTEPYYHMYDGYIPLKSHDYAKYSPILSMVTTDKNSDVPMPTFEDWARVVSETNNEFFKEPCNSYRETFDTPWENKKGVAAWRGASTGCGTKVETNPRLMVSYLSVKNPDKINAGIVKWNIRPRKEQNNAYITTIDLKGDRNSRYLFHKGVRIPQVERMTPSEQSKYKYIIHVDGHVSAFRLSYEMKMGSVLLLVESQYRMWFRPLLKPYEHYVPVNGDLSNLVSQIEWCRNNDEECKKIAQNSRKFYYTYLEKDGVLDYIQNLLVKLRKSTDVYFYPPPLNEISLKEKQVVLDEWGKNTEQECAYNTDPKLKFRCFGLFEAIRWMTLDKNWEKFTIKEIGSTLSPSSTTTISNFNIFGMPAILKTSKEDKIKENVNEAFVAAVATNELLKIVPNFRFVFKIDDDKMWMENIQGITLSDFINRHDVQAVFSHILKIMTQVLLAIHVSQQRAGFIHRDLTPWNIILQYPNAKLSFKYPVDFNRVFECTINKGDFIPIMIDYGKSSVIHDGMRYDPEDTFDFSHDVIFFLCRTFYELIKLREQDISISDKNTIVNIFNSLNLIDKPFPDFNRVKNWLQNNHQYSILSTLTSKNVTAIGLVNVINTYSQNIKINSDSFSSSMRNINPSQMYTMFRGQPNKIYDSFTSVLDNFISSSLPNPTTRLQCEFLHHTIIKELNALSETYKLFGNNTLLIPKIQKIGSFIDKLYTDSRKNLKSSKPVIREDKDLHIMKLMMVDIFDRASPELKDELKDLLRMDTGNLLLSWSKYKTDYHFNNIIEEDLKNYLEKIKVN